MSTMLISILIVLLAVVLFIMAVLIFRAVMYGHVPANISPAEIPQPDATLVAEHLAAAIQVQTISRSTGEQPDARAFEELQRALERMYPRVHAALQRERINKLSLLYTWHGSAPELEPVLLYSHVDVVPFDPATRAEWSHPPFAGDVADGFVWGRGALDNKSTVITMCEAVEGLIRAGYQPARTLMIALGHDEEIGGKQGAACIADMLAERGVRLAAVLDEGAAVMAAGMLPGMPLPVALIGIAEKGYASVELRVEGRPGHSSMPPVHTAIGVLARAIARLEANPMPARLSINRLMFEKIGAFMPFSMRLAFANDRLFNGMLRSRLLANPQSAALVRTTMAATMIQGGLKDNILPASAMAVVNCRLLPGDTRAIVMEHIRRVVNDEAVQVNLEESNGWEASSISSPDGPVYQRLSQATRQIFPDAVVAPCLVAGATDSRYFTSLCSNVYHFSPLFLDSELLRGIHGNDERIPVETLAGMVSFFHLLIRSWTAADGAFEG